MKSEKDKIPHDFSHMWNLKTKQMSRGKKKRERKQTKKQTLNYGEHNAGYQRGGGGGMGDTYRDEQNKEKENKKTIMSYKKEKKTRRTG